MHLIPLVLVLIVPWRYFEVFRLHICYRGYFALVQQSVQVQFSIRVSTWIDTRTGGGRVFNYNRNRSILQETLLTLFQIQHKATAWRNANYSPLLFNSTSSILRQEGVWALSVVKIYFPIHVIRTPQRALEITFTKFCCCEKWIHLNKLSWTITFTKTVLSQMLSDTGIINFKHGTRIINHLRTYSPEY